MSYLLEDNTQQITGDIIKRKEFNQYRLNKYVDKNELEKSIIPRFLISKMIKDGNYLQFHSYQLFVSNYINPNTPYSRLLMKWQTGTGKSIGSLSVAMNFIKYFQKEEVRGSTNIGSVYIMGFTSQIFYNEILRFPEFGIITRRELKKLKTLKKMAYNGTKYDKEHLQEFKMKIKKRFSNRQNSGFFKFIGYKKLVNMIFKIRDPELQLNKLDENGISNAIKEKKIILDTNVLNQFKNSLIICDEIHNVYNSLNKNNWGVALQYVLNSHSSVRALFMSATPINNSPTEIIDLLNLLLPNIHYPTLLNKKEFFNDDQTLKRGALDKISSLCKGRVSYIRDVNPIYYPSKTFIGECIKNIPYIKFVRCPMSQFQYTAYKEAYDGHLSSDSQYVIDFALPNPNGNIGLYQTSDIKKYLQHAPQKWQIENKIYYRDNKIMGDILRLKNLPKISAKYTKMMHVINDIIANQKGKVFIYHNVIHMSGVLFIQEILLQNHIISEYANSTANTLCSICGNPRHMHNSAQLGGGVATVSEYSEKYNENTQSNNVYWHGQHVLDYKLCDNKAVISSIFIDFEFELESIFNYVAERYPLIFKVYRNHIQLTNYFKKYKYKLLSSKTKQMFYSKKSYSKSMTDNLVRKINKSFEKKGGYDKSHTYMPVRFIALHSELDRNSMNNSLDKYNSPDNFDGGRIMILIGGRLIKEAYDIKAVRELMVMGRPDNIPTLIQILGRAVRKKSHHVLPPEKRNVNIRIFTSCLPVKKNGQYELSHEEEKYKIKMQHYKVIQNIEKIMHENAVDSYINQDIIWNEQEKKLYAKEQTKDLGSLYFKPNIPQHLNRTFKLNELNLQTFNAFNADDEITNIIIIIKRLFIEKSPVWTYEDLFYSVKKSPMWFQVEFNTELISEDLFIIALSRLVWSKNNEYIEPIIHSNTTQIEVNNVIDRLFNTDDKIIMMPGNQKSVINQVGIYYILFPIDQVQNEPIKNIESPYRITKEYTQTRIDVKNFLEDGNSFVNYSDKRDRFYVKWNNVSITKLEMAVCDFGTDFHISFLEECIEYVFNVWTDPNLKKSTMHAFYFKMLNYYDLRRLVIWGHTLKPDMFKKYSIYIKQIKTKIKDTAAISQQKLKEIETKEKDVSTSGLINLLKSSINKSDLNWVSTGLKTQFENNLDKSLKLFDGKFKKKSKKTLVDADLIPVGHFLNVIPKFYHPDTNWFDSPEYLTDISQFTENPTLIGYDERSKTGVHIRFKIRSPIQNIKQYKDSRLIEKGSVCSSKSKVYLKEVAQKLGIKLEKKLNVNKLCNQIRTKLIYLELKERIANTKIKWFYFIYEKRPEITDN